jgi:hypothetical protein
MLLTFLTNILSAFLADVTALLVVISIVWWADRRK